FCAERKPIRRQTTCGELLLTLSEGTSHLLQYESRLMTPLSSALHPALPSPADTPPLTDAHPDFADLVGRALAPRWLAETAERQDTSSAASTVVSAAPSVVSAGRSST